MGRKEQNGIPLKHPTPTKGTTKSVWVGPHSRLAASAVLSAPKVDFLCLSELLC